MPFQKGKSGNPKGRPKHIPNKVTGEVKAMVLQALANAGGVAYLEQQAKANPNAFLTLVGKVLPLQLTGEGGGPILTRVVHQDFRIQDE